MEYEDDKPKTRRKMKEVLHSTKRLTKAEIRQMVSTILKEILRDELDRLFAADTNVRRVLVDVFRDYLDSDRFVGVLTMMLAYDMNRIRSLLEDTMIASYSVKENKRVNRPVGAKRPKERKVRL